MSTKGQLLEELAACESYIIRRKRQADEKVRKEEVRLEKIDKNRQALLAMHQQRVDEMQAEFDRQLDCVEQRAAEDIELATQAKDKALEHIRLSVDRTEAAEQRCRELEQRIQEVYTAIHQKGVEHDRLFQHVRDEADKVVTDMRTDADRQVVNVAMFSSEVQDEALNSILAMQKDARTLIYETDQQASQRSKIRELYTMQMSHAAQSNQDKSASLKELHEKKRQTILGWFDDWNNATSSDKISARAASITSTWSKARAAGELVPTTPRPRSVVTARHRAEELQRQTFNRSAPLALGSYGYGQHGSSLATAGQLATTL